MSLVTKSPTTGDAINVSISYPPQWARIFCFAPGGDDLTKSASTITMNALNAVSQFERDLLIGRSNRGLTRQLEGKALGPCSTTFETEAGYMRGEVNTVPNSRSGSAEIKSEIGLRH